MLQQSLAVFLVLGLLLAALWLLRRQGLASFGFSGGARLLRSRNSDRHLRVIERLALTPQHTLHLVSMRDQMLLLATSPAGCQRIDPPPPQVADQDAAASLQSGATC